MRTGTFLEPAHLYVAHKYGLEEIKPVFMSRKISIRSLAARRSGSGWTDGVAVRSVARDTNNSIRRQKR